MRHEALNWRAHAASSQCALMALPLRTKRPDRVQPRSPSLPCAASSGLCTASEDVFMCRMTWDPVTVTHPFAITPPQPPPLVECSVPSPSQVEMMYDLCCQLPSRVRAELIMTRSSLLCQHHTPFCCSPCSYSLDVTCVYGCVKEWAGCFFSRLLPCTHTSPHPLPNNKDQYKTQSLTCKWLS